MLASEDIDWESGMEPVDGEGTCLIMEVRLAAGDGVLQELTGDFTSA